MILDTVIVTVVGQVVRTSERQDQTGSWLWWSLKRKKKPRSVEDRQEGVDSNGAGKSGRGSSCRAAKVRKAKCLDEPLRFPPSLLFPSSLPLLSPSPFPLLPFPTLPFPSSSPSLPLDIGSLNSARGLGERCKFASGVWGGAPAEIEFGAF